MLCIVLCAAALALVGIVVYRRVMWPSPLRSGEGPVRIACVGDSITYSLGVLGQRKRWSYPALLVGQLGTEYSAVNYGLSDRALLSTSDKPYFAEKRGQAAWNAEADVILFMLGSNDCKRKNWNAALFEKEYEEAVLHYQRRAAKQLAVMIPPRIFYAKPGKSGYDDAILRDEVSRIARSVAENRGVACIDLYALTKDHPEWFPDKLHPNKAGNAAIAELIAAKLTELSVRQA